MIENNFMQPKRYFTFLTILFQLLFFSFFAGANTFQENPLSKAIQLFDKENYTEAEPLFEELDINLIFKVVLLIALIIYIFTVFIG